MAETRTLRIAAALSSVGPDVSHSRCQASGTPWLGLRGPPAPTPPPALRSPLFRETRLIRAPDTLPRPVWDPCPCRPHQAGCPGLSRQPAPVPTDSRHLSLCGRKDCSAPASDWLAERSERGREGSKSAPCLCPRPRGPQEGSGLQDGDCGVSDRGLAPGRLPLCPPVLPGPALAGGLLSFVYTRCTSYPGQCGWRCAERD